MLTLFKKKPPEEPVITARPVFSKGGMTKVRDYVKYVNGKPVHVSGYEVLRKPGKQDVSTSAPGRSDTTSASALSSSSPTRSSASASPRSEAEAGRLSTVPVPAEFLQTDFMVERELTHDKLVGFHQAFNTAMASFLSKIGKLSKGRPFPNDLKYHRTFKESLESFASSLLFGSVTDRFGNSISMHPYTYFHLSDLGRYFDHIDRSALYTFANEYLNARYSKDKKNYHQDLQSAFNNFEHRLEAITADRGVLLHLSALPDILKDPDMVFAYPGKYVYLKSYNDTAGVMGRKNFPYKAVASLTTDNPTQSKERYTSIARSIRSGKRSPVDLVKTHLVWKRGQNTLTKSWGKKSLNLNVDYFFLLTPQQFTTHAPKIFCYSR